MGSNEKAPTRCCVSSWFISCAIDRCFTREQIRRMGSFLSVSGSLRCIREEFYWAGSTWLWVYDDEPWVWRIIDDCSSRGGMLDARWAWVRITDHAVWYVILFLRFIQHRLVFLFLLSGRAWTPRSGWHGINGDALRRRLRWSTAGDGCSRRSSRISYRMLESLCSNSASESMQIKSSEFIMGYGQQQAGFLLLFDAQWRCVLLESRGCVLFWMVVHV